MKPLTDALAPLLERLKAMTLKQRMGLIAAVTALVAVGLWAWASATAVKYGVLFGNLEQGDAAQIIEKLRENKVPYKLEQAGTQILVPEETVHETRLTLAGEGLPSGGGVGFELFDEQRFGESEFSEQVKYHRALEGELSRTITHLSGVESARVHLVLPSRSLFASADNAASASVALRLKPGARLSRDQTRGIVNLVASSVRGLTPQGVTVVDGSGRRLSGGDDENETVTNSLEFQRNYERGLTRDLQQILDTAIGAGTSVVRVAAEVTFAREEVTEELIDPTQTTSRSFQIVEEHDQNSNVTSGGVPGAVSTLEGADPSLATKPQQGLVRRSETRNYEISKTTRKTAQPVGRVTRISVAVAVDGHWKGKGEKRAFTARSPQELQTIKNILISAAGVKDARGDQIAVECVPFASSDDAVAAADEGGKTIEVLVKKHWPYAAGAAGLLVLLLGVSVALLLRKKKLPEGEPEPMKLPDGVTVELSKQLPGVSTETSDVAQATLETIAGRRESLPPADDHALPEDTQREAEKLRALTAEIAAADPYLAARVIRAWLREANEQAPKDAPTSPESEVAA
ncbi:MAG TPA: flagellar basal-body MS-ring/collar protein FliF [Polyangiales bacterium]